MEQAEKANYDEKQIKNLTTTCQSQAKSFGTVWLYRDRQNQEDALNALPVSDKTKKIVHEFISPTTICHQIGADVVLAFGAAGGAGGRFKFASLLTDKSGLSRFRPVYKGAKEMDLA